jgi:hypothetical protein
MKKREVLKESVARHIWMKIMPFIWMNLLLRESAILMRSDGLIGQMVIWKNFGKQANHLE